MKVYVFEDADWDKTLELVDTTTEYGLTGSMWVVLITGLRFLLIIPSQLRQ